MPAELTSAAASSQHRRFLKAEAEQAPGSPGIADEVRPSQRDEGASAVAAVIHATSDQALREPKQTNETGRDDQQSQDSGCGADVET